ncbi:MAG: Do family serine endopeptidase [Bacteroidetes bacterium]|nr:Do family serine endopeptidase [Bacteroidota bacterium]MBL0063662.1 Do family serine endopeptidase [Bacteroidota bacterium]MBL0139910.1 Do family serine endopeptidase [Bacteroidota bacterium]
MIRQFKKAISFLLIAGLGGAAGAYIYSSSSSTGFSISQKNNSSNAGVQYVNMPNAVDAALPDFTKAADMTVHAVVHVKTFYANKNMGFSPFGYNPFDFWGRPQQAPQQESSGSGVIITDDGYIVTNNHVVENAEKVEVTMNDNRTFNAKVVGTDPSTDLALLKIDEKGLPYVPYGNSDILKVGEWVMAVGNPFNLTSTVTAGIVSAKARNIGILPDQFKIESFIQTDAAVNPGNSGGALVNTRGELVGINSAIASNTGSYTGYSFAIPVNLVKKVMDDLVEFGNVQRGFIGVSIRDVDSKLADEKGLKETQGIYVAGLSEGGAASEAGLKEGDIITKVGEVSVNSTPQLQEQIGRFRPGDKVNVTVIRDGSEKTFAVVLRNKDGDTKVVKNDQVLNLLGGTFENISKDDQAKLGIQGGVKISKLMPGKLRSAGIREGFIITSIDKKPVRTMEDIDNALKTKQGGVLVEGIYPNGLRAYYGFGI